MVSFEIISVVAFLVILGFVVYRDRKKIEFKYILLMRRTQKGKEWVYSFGKKHEKILKILGTLGVVTAILASLYGSYLLVKSTYNLITKPEETPQPLKLVLPTVSGVELPNFVLGVPFWYWIIGVFLVMISHEGMHALLARAERIKIKSFGVLLLLFLPGAFVEPDEKQLKKSSTMKKLRIYAAGSFGNFILALTILILLLSYSFILNKIIVPQGIIFEKLIPGTGAESASLSGMITQINSMSVKDVNDFVKSLEKIKPGDTIEVKTTTGIFNVKTTSHPDDPTKPYIGIQNTKVSYIYIRFLSNYGAVSSNTITVLTWFSNLLEWSFVLSLGVGIFNLFPLKPLDGGLMFEEILKYFYKGKAADKIINLVSIIILLLVVFNLFGAHISGLFI